MLPKMKRLLPTVDSKRLRSLYTTLYSRRDLWWCTTGQLWSLILADVNKRTHVTILVVIDLAIGLAAALLKLMEVVAEGIVIDGLGRE